MIQKRCLGFCAIGLFSDCGHRIKSIQIPVISSRLHFYRNSMNSDNSANSQRVLLYLGRFPALDSKLNYCWSGRIGSFFHKTFTERIKAP